MNKKSEEPSTIDCEREIHGQSVDYYLQQLVSLANENEYEIGITLLLGGSVVSGILIGGRKYFDTFAADFSAAWTGEDKDEIHNSFAAYGDIYDPAKRKQLPMPPQYIHLQNARIQFLNGSMPTNGGVLWRGKINAVSGFHLGMLAYGGNNSFIPKPVYEAA
ncbi:gas vesicle accessory protein GvpU [Polaromonas sp. JS666]|uniref:gas vesicle accessory protein GvpU n=1 Tax=Polaromonas sp. (strain JS666 / ATCC BAA-500) TaxID=296591 RepID=UPI000053487F|nr:gas vesicle accessory protein GvpU [Polaromonas sp. JS666]ABE43295.1 gas vesicle protein [Polaromonas sp. JS666]UUZ73265.1 gas vesicle protein [Polaromonas sp. P1(28)-8]